MPGPRLHISRIWHRCFSTATFILPPSHDDIEQDLSRKHIFSPSTSHVIRFFLKALSTVAIIWYLLQSMDLDAVVHQALSIDTVYIVTATVLGWLISLLASVRWYYVIQATGYHLTWYRTFQLTMVGTFFNQILPSAMGGDLVRIPYAHQSGLPPGSAINSVVLDRVVAMFALVLIVFVSLPLALSVLDASHARWTLITVAAGGLAGTAVLLSAAQIPGLFRLIPSSNR